MLVTGKNRSLQVLAPVFLFALLALVVVLVACDGGEVPIVYRQSPPPPLFASANMISTTAKALGVDGTAGVVVLPPHTPDGKPVTINLLDKDGAKRFDPASLTFAVGEAVNFTLKAEDEFHTFTITDLELDAGVNQQETLNFGWTFDRAGTYSFVCIPHSGDGMTGTLTVQ